MCGPITVDLQPGDIVFSFDKSSWISDLFSWFMQSKWSHCFLIVDKSPLRTFEVETSDYDVVVSVFEDKYLNKDFSLEVWRPTGLDETTLLQIGAVGITTENRPYGYLQLLSLGIRRLLRRIGINIPNFIHCGLNCYEVVLYPYATVQGTPFTGLDYMRTVDTEDLYQKVIHGPFQKVFTQD